MRLLLDLGNTRLKWALHEAALPTWRAQGVVEWGEDLATVLGVAWSGFPDSTQVVAASVVDEARERRLATLVQQRFGTAPIWVRTPASACGVHNAYAEPQRLGVDRFLAMVAAHAAGRTPCVLASAGTALVLDALNAEGRHLGGLIAPGVQLMQRALLDATAQVRPQRAGEILEVADNTADAVTSGCWHAAAALVERFHAHMRPRLDGQPALVLDGGDAPLLAGLLSLPVLMARDSVLHGLALWANAHLPTPASP